MEGQPVGLEHPFPQTPMITNHINTLAATTWPEVAGEALAVVLILGFLLIFFRE
ncbi:hypothetical protein GCM10023212_05040 [Luteolibacter yonseiensis]